MLAFWGLGLALGRPLVSQTDYTGDGHTFGMPCSFVCLSGMNLLKHVTQ